MLVHRFSLCSFFFVLVITIFYSNQFVCVVVARPNRARRAQENGSGLRHIKRQKRERRSRRFSDNNMEPNHDTSQENVDNGRPQNSAALSMTFRSTADDAHNSSPFAQDTLSNINPSTYRQERQGTPVNFFEIHNEDENSGVLPAQFDPLLHRTTSESIQLNRNDDDFTERGLQSSPPVFFQKPPAASFSSLDTFHPPSVRQAGQENNSFSTSNVQTSQNFPTTEQEGRRGNRRRQRQNLGQMTAEIPVEPTTRHREGRNPKNSASPRMASERVRKMNASRQQQLSF